MRWRWVAIGRHVVLTGTPPLCVQIDQAFNIVDLDGDGFVSPAELQAALRTRVSIDPLFAPGAAGPIIIAATNEIALRPAATSTTRSVDIDHQRGVGDLERSSLPRSARVRAGSADELRSQLRAVLATNAVRVVDLFRDWDVDSDGAITRQEFCNGIAKLAVGISPAEADFLFDGFDDICAAMNGRHIPGLIQFSELHRLLRQTRQPPKPGGAVPGGVEKPRTRLRPTLLAGVASVKSLPRTLEQVKVGAEKLRERLDQGSEVMLQLRNELAESSREIGEMWRTMSQARVQATQLHPPPPPPPPPWALAESALLNREIAEQKRRDARRAALLDLRHHQRRSVLRTSEVCVALRCCACVSLVLAHSPLHPTAPPTHQRHRTAPNIPYPQASFHRFQLRMARSRGSLPRVEAASTGGDMKGNRVLKPAGAASMPQLGGFDGRQSGNGPGRKARDGPAWLPLPPPAAYPLTHLRPDALENAKKALLVQSISLPLL